MNDIFILIFLLIFSGIFSGSETALTAIPFARIESLVEEGKKGAIALLKLKQNPSHMLITLLIGNNLVNISASAFATVVATKYFGSMGPGIAVGILTVLILIFGEITPKSFAIRYSVYISLSVAPLILLLMRLLFPLILVFEYITNFIHKFTSLEEAPSVTEAELLNLLKRGVKEGIIEKDEVEMVERVFAFNDVKVNDVMTSIHKVFSLKDTLTVKEALSEIARVGFSRIPIYDKEPNNITRIIHWSDIIKTIEIGKENMQLKELGYTPSFIPKNQAIDKLFAELQIKKRHLAIVVDEFGNLRGIVTMEDLLEELVGDIYDEKDPDPLMIKELEDGIEVDGSVELRVLKNHLDVELRGKNSDSVSHWILNDIERIPQVNECFTIDGLNVEIHKASGRRIYKVKISQ
jgi:CBS domain containing-hemolysin-like protein